MSATTRAIANMLDVICDTTGKYVHMELYVPRDIYMELELDCQRDHYKPPSVTHMTGLREVRINHQGGDVIIRNIDDGYAHVIVTKE